MVDVHVTSTISASAHMPIYKYRDTDIGVLQSAIVTGFEIFLWQCNLTFNSLLLISHKLANCLGTNVCIEAIDWPVIRGAHSIEQCSSDEWHNLNPYGTNSNRNEGHLPIYALTFCNINEIIHLFSSDQYIHIYE